MNPNVRVIGAVGQNGSGKDEVLKYLNTSYGVPYVATGDIVREITAREGLELTRENLGKVSERYFRQYGKGCFVKMAADKIIQNGWKTAGISGVRTPADIATLKDTFGDNFILIRVYVTEPKKRFERMVRRAKERDPVTYEQFLQQDKTEEERFSVKEVEAKADYSLSNDGTLEDLHREIDLLVKDKGIINSQSN